jgi:hypothetical protein
MYDKCSNDFVISGLLIGTTTIQTKTIQTHEMFQTEQEKPTLIVKCLIEVQVTKAIQPYPWLRDYWEEVTRVELQEKEYSNKEYNIVTERLINENNIY